MKTLVLLLALLLLLPMATAQQKPTTPSVDPIATLQRSLADTQGQVEALQRALTESQTTQEALLATLAGNDETLKTLLETQRALGTQLSEKEAALQQLQDKLAATQRLAAQQGMPLYQKHCASCHGADGKGNGPAATFLAVAPRNLVEGSYKFRSTPSGSPPTREDMLRTLQKGILPAGMPGWETQLSSNDLWLLVSVLASFSQQAASTEEVLAISTKPVFDKTLVEEGKAVYQVLGCAQCHGESGDGRGKTGALQDETGRRILATNFLDGRYKSGTRSEDLYRSIMTGLDGTPMPAYADSFAYPAETTSSSQSAEAQEASPETIERRRWALVAYLESLQKPRRFWHWLFARN
jgi:mono/diheme cytochrome c family protein